MLHCKACDKQLTEPADFCSSCIDAIERVYSGDSKWISAIKGRHPQRINTGLIITGSFNDDFFDWKFNDSDFDDREI